MRACLWDSWANTSLWVRTCTLIVEGQQLISISRSYCLVLFCEVEDASGGKCYFQWDWYFYTTSILPGFHGSNWRIFVQVWQVWILHLQYCFCTLVLLITEWEVLGGFYNILFPHHFLLNFLLSLADMNSISLLYTTILVLLITEWEVLGGIYNIYLFHNTSCLVC